MRMKQINDEDFIKAVKVSESFRELFDLLGIICAGGNYLTAKLRAKRLGLNISHFSNKPWNKGKKTGHSPNRIDLEEILIENSTYTSTNGLKKKLLDAKIFERKCYKCNTVEWNNELIPLELDHINGIRTDNRLTNLQLLCPNCHAQTDTYRGKNIGRSLGGIKADSQGLSPCVVETPNSRFESEREYQNYCIKCSKRISKYSIRCKRCSNEMKIGKTKISWPSTSKLIKMVQLSSFTHVGKMLGVSDNAVRKRITNHL